MKMGPRAAAAERHCTSGRPGERAVGMRLAAAMGTDIELDATSGTYRQVSLGVSLVLESCCREEVARGSLRALRLRDGPLAKTLHAAHPEDDPPSGLAADLLEHLQREGRGAARARGAA